MVVILTIETIRELCTPEKINITIHATKRLEQREIKLSDVMTCISSGEIIEQYPEDYPYPSCLILGMSCGEKYLHCVIGTDNTQLWIVTAYFPDPKQWSDDFKTRLEVIL